jgi:hypothetical protein
MGYNRSGWDSEKIKSAVRDKRVACGYKFNRQLLVDEQRAFLDEDKVPADALTKRTFLSEKRMDAIPPGFKCMCCGEDLSGRGGVLVNVGSESHKFRTICSLCYATVVGNDGDEVGDEQEQEQAPASVPATPASESVAELEAALATIKAAITAPKAPPTPPVDEAKIIAEACAKAREAAKEAAKGVMRESIKDFIASGSAPSSCGTSSQPEEDETSSLPPAKYDCVEVATNASGWTAKANKNGVEAVEKLNAFLSEFSYFRDGVSMRLINTFARSLSPAGYLESYCEVSNMEDLPELREKMKSPEFDKVVDLFAKFAPKALNKRFAVFYGSPGGGKTYAAVEACKKINDGDCETMLCSPSMDAADMLYAYRFDYKSGKRGYVPTALLNAMLAGRAVVLDEINLLPMEARMFLQNILDNKSKVSVMGIELPIKDGFFVIGTMNLETGLGSSPLPLPLVDRACIIKNFRTSAEQAAVGAGLC